VSCGSSDDPTPDDPSNEDSEFESAAPGGGRGAAAGDPAAPPSAEDADAGGNPAARAIEEADIIKVEGTRLYAFSRPGGLSVIDVTKPDALKVLGRFKLDAAPFELYVRGDVVLALYDGYGRYERTEDGKGYLWVSSSQVVAIDMSDPKAPVQLDSFSVSGNVSDSRIVGDVLYVVAHQPSSCWGCEDGRPKTTVMSLNVAKPTAIKEVEQLSFEDKQSQWGWDKKSVTVTEQRMYIAGEEYSEKGFKGSSIQVIDITDPAGDMVEGATIQAAGWVQSRWQMDEFDGHLRVVTQAGGWEPGAPPHLQTFKIESSAELTPLADVTFVIPNRDTLRSVRFDGFRGYAITAEQQDPLYTLDFSDPAAPKQVGELKIPGWLMHMEPRGERLYGLGFDPANPEGSVNISIFDVSVLETPTLLDRVNFGGDWGWVPEDQDRIHKAFKILPEANLILMPFSGSSPSQNETCGYGGYFSGIQLIDTLGDTLVRRGAAETFGEARRGLLIGERLFAVSDDRVQVFDITDRDKPASTNYAALANNVSRTVSVGDSVVRVATNWYTSQVELQVVTAANPDTTTPLSTLTIDQLGEVDTCYQGGWVSDLHAVEGAVIVSLDTWGQTGEGKELIAVDVTNPKTPKIISRLRLGSANGGTEPADSSVGEWGYGYYQAAHLPSGLALLGQNFKYDRDGQPLDTSSKLLVLDYANPAKPKQSLLELPSAESSWETTFTIAKDVIAIGRAQSVAKQSHLRRHYVDRIDISDLSKPAFLDSVNVPGVLLSYDAETGRAISQDLTYLEAERVSAEKCYMAKGQRVFVPEDQDRYDGPGLCYPLESSLNLLRFEGGKAYREDRIALPDSSSFTSYGVGDDRLFIQVVDGQRYYGGGVASDIAIGGCFDCGGYWGPVMEQPMDLRVYSGLKSGKLLESKLTVKGGDFWGWSNITASGTKAVISSGWRGQLTVLDASDPEQLKQGATLEIVGYPSNIEMTEEQAVVSLGYDGVVVLPLE
jgi:uncharacterized secreted protein with C-terminal beta-propeller domain